jgi:hypothetical protein
MSKEHIEALEAQLRATRMELRDTQRILLVTYLTGAKATQVAMAAGLDCTVDQEEMIDALARFDSGDISIERSNS